MSTPRHLLLVEDNPDDLFFMQRALRTADVRQPHSVVTTGLEAVAYLKGEGKFADRGAFPAPALVLLDLKLPGMDGHEVLCWIRAQPAWRRLVVVILTTSRERSDVQQAYANGANAYLVKPSAAPELIAQVKALKAFWLEQNEFAVPGA